MGADRSEFVCTPGHLMRMLDEMPDAPGQLRDIRRWYAWMDGERERRENERLRPRLRDAMAPTPDRAAQEEIERAMEQRAIRRSTTPEEELDRLIKMLDED